MNLDLGAAQIPEDVETMPPVRTAAARKTWRETFLRRLLYGPGQRRDRSLTDFEALLSASLLRSGFNG